MLLGLFDAIQDACHRPPKDRPAAAKTFACKAAGPGGVEFGPARRYVSRNKNLGRIA